MRTRVHSGNHPKPVAAFTSPLFRKSNIDKALTLAIRGVPQAWQQTEVPVDLEKARQVYEDEIRLLDALHLRRRLFPSGVLGAALIGLVLDPASIELWRAFNESHWIRHDDGRIDPAGWLLAESSRHTGHKLITLRHDYQHYLFQSGLAVVQHGTHCRERGLKPWLTGPPPPVSIPDLLMVVRARKKQRLSEDLFRPKATLVGRIPRLQPVAVSHRVDYDLVGQITRRACKLQRFACKKRAQRRGMKVLKGLSVPTELAAPGALAAAVATIGRDPGAERIWKDAFAGRWSHRPGEGTTTAGQLVQAIGFHNRQPHGLNGELALMARCCMAIKTHRRMLRTVDEPRLVLLPRAGTAAVRELKAACAGLSIDPTPELHYGYIEPYGRADYPRRKRLNTPYNRGRTGRKGEKIFKKVHDLYGWPRPGQLIDRRADGCGYDYGIVERPDEPEWAVEAKTVQPGKQFTITEKQWERAQEMGDRYWLVLILRSPEGKRFAAIRNPSAVLPVRENLVVIRQINQAVSSADWARILEGQWAEFEGVDGEDTFDASRKGPEPHQDDE
jgi:hypothetical protein